MDLFTALLIALVVWLLISLEAWLSYPMINVPLVVSPIVGLILGDFEQGVVIGATLQLVFLGVMQIGGTLPSDATLGAAIGTAFAISMGQSTEVALTFAVPVALLGSFLTLFGYLLRGLFNPLVERLCATGNAKGLERLHVALAFLPELPKGIVIFAALYFGTGFAQDLIEIIPQTVIDGLDYASDLMPAVGIALLLRMMWSKKMSVYFFLGVILVAFFNLEMLGVAVTGVVISVIMLLESNNKGGKEVALATSSEAATEEDLFND